MRLCLLALAGLVASAVAFSPPTSTACPHGQMFIDECENQCNCRPDGRYACTRKGCYDENAWPEKPMTCEVDGEIRIEGKNRLICKHGIVIVEDKDNPDACLPETSWQDGCNTCHCTPGGRADCTQIACDESPLVPSSGNLTPLSGGGGGVSPEGTPYCEGQGCPADCGEELDASRGCLRCVCGLQRQFGDLIIAADQPCPQGLREGARGFATKICQGQGCTPGAIWKVNDGCSTCKCTEDGEPACTPCRRQQTENTVTCEGGLPECPQDCGSAYNAEADCLECPCGVGEPGDVSVNFDEFERSGCPPGTDFREAGAFFVACGPVDTLPKGDTQFCDGPESQCPADCGTVRVSRQEGCVYCQCGPELAEGDEVVGIEEECRSPRLVGATQLATKVCRAPTRQECLPGTTYNIKCDICLCGDDGVPFCTKRDCSLPKYGDVQVCETKYLGGPGAPKLQLPCPADCGTVGEDQYCRFCQCGPRLEEGDVVVGIDEPCPPGTVFKEAQFATKTCKVGGNPPVPATCEHGPAFIDECDNDCQCLVTGEGYGCTRKACRPGQTSGKPIPCGSSGELPRRPPSVRVYCHEGIVKFQPRDEPCVAPSWSMDKDYCNRCSCTEPGLLACTLKACIETTENTGCQYGPEYIDECDNDCSCHGGEFYGCTRKACRPGQTAKKPLSCSSAADLPQRTSRRVFCHEGIVKTQDKVAPCIQGSVFKNDCNDCNCFEAGQEACTYKACL